MVHRCVRGVDILGLLIGEDAPAKGHHIPPQVENGEHDPAPVAVVEMAVFRAAAPCPTGAVSSWVYPLFLQVVHQGVAAVWGIAQTKMADGLLVQAPAAEIVQPSLPLWGGEHPIVKPPRFPVDLQDPGAQPGHGQRPHRLPAGACPARWARKLYRFGKVQVLHPHDKGDHIPAFVAAKAVKGVVLRIDAERRRLFIVERAQAHQVFPPPTAG